KHSGSTLTWGKSSSKDVVGYRIFRASEPGDDFKLIGHSTDTNYDISKDDAVYYVKAVDYFGLESKATEEMIVGDVDETDEDDEQDAEQDSDKEETENGQDDDHDDEDDHDEDEDEDENDDEG